MSCNEESFLRLISLTTQAMRKYADQKLKKFDLTIEQLHIMKHLDGEQGCPQRELCHGTDKSPANVTRMLDRMEKKDLVVRQASPNDRRASLVFLTKEGAALKEEVLSLFKQLETDLLSNIDDEQQRVAFKVLGIIKAKIEINPILKGEGKR